MTPTAAEELRQALDDALAGVGPAPATEVHGGCIGAAWRWPLARGGAVFVKTVAAGDEPMLAAEAAGLAEIASAGAVRVPGVLAHGRTTTQAWLALEWLDLMAPSADSDAAFGAALAALHRVRAARYGWAADNFIGRTPQPNGWSDDWLTFLRERRLRPQVALARANGHAGCVRRADLLIESAEALYGCYTPIASLLHGDLWHGNRSSVAGGEPVVYDPAPYYGDREADLAMTRLFGGFGPRFYAAYQLAWPLDAAAGYRRDLHNLYHVLNHLNLFGGPYAAQAEAMIDGLLAEVGR
jgi:protein-ribulosamine 3-kinase